MNWHYKTTFAQNTGDVFIVDVINYKVLTADKATKTGTVEVTGPAGTLDNELVIPATVTTSFESEEWTFTITAIRDEAFKNATITTLDLSESTSLEQIGESAFADNLSLVTIKFPPAIVSKLTKIGTQAFHHAFSLQSINLEDTRIEVLESYFSKNEDDEITIEGLKELKLPETLKEIKPYALQFLDIREIEIPSSVTTFGNRVLEGCIYLRVFTWKQANITKLPFYTFLGDDKLESVTLLTITPLEPDGLSDKHFFMCDKDILRVYVTAESIANLATLGYTNENSIYSTLVAYTDDPSDIEGITTEDKNNITGPTNNSDNTYTLQGVKVRETEQGRIYIRNGKKFIAK